MSPVRRTRFGTWIEHIYSIVCVEDCGLHSQTNWHYNCLYTSLLNLWKPQYPWLIKSVIECPIEKPVCKFYWGWTIRKSWAKKYTKRPLGIENKHTFFKPWYCLISALKLDSSCTWWIIYKQRVEIPYKNGG